MSLDFQIKYLKSCINNVSSSKSFFFFFKVLSILGELYTHTHTVTLFNFIVYLTLFYM